MQLQILCPRSFPPQVAPNGEIFLKLLRLKKKGHQDPKKRKISLEYGYLIPYHPPLEGT
jgi:hypothetical protein